MSEFFLIILNMSISASWIVLAVLLLRLLLKKAPKWITVLLWGIVAVRLICPFTIESVMSLIPNAETISPEIMMDRTPEINSGIPVINNVVNPSISESFAPDPAASANPLQILIPVLSLVWVVGIVGMLLYTVISYFRVKQKIRTAVLLRENIFQSESVVSPFVLGIIKPKIYLPFNMNEQDMEHVIAHEQAHIRRKDHWWKPLGFLILTLHWFNPLMWLGYVLLCRDVELACDEKVIKELNPDQKADYSQALLSCSVNRRMIAACPLAFGEVGVKDRVKSVLNYKKPAFWIIVVAIVASIVTAVCFLTNPRTSLDDELSVFLDMQIAEHHYSEGHTDDNFVAVHHKVLDVDKSLKETTVYMWVLYHEYSCENSEIKLEAGAHIPTVITAKRTGSHGHYELVEYWEPRDGSDYAKDIKEKFPWYLHGKALDSQRYIHEQKAFCENAAKEYYSAFNVGGADDPDNVTVNSDDSTGIHYPNNQGLYEVTPTDEIQSKYDNEEFVIQKLHYKANDGTWVCENHTYKYRLEISGRLNNAEKNTTYIVLSNSKDITFEQTWKASGLSSLMSDYFDPKDAVIVGHRLFSISSTNDLATAIASVLNEKYCAEKPDGLLHIETYHLLANEIASGTPLKGNSGHMEEATVYLLVYHMKYSVNGGQLEEVEGGFVPTAISFKIDENGQYVLKEHWTPRSGANYEKDVLGKFPGESATDVLKTEQYAEDLIKENWRLASEALSKIKS